MTAEPLRKLLVHELKDLYSAEHQLIDALPNMVKAANDPDLKQAFTDHLSQTRTHVTRLEKAFEKLDVKEVEGEPCMGMEGLIEEGKKVLEEGDLSAVRDAAIISSAQRIEHYEIAAYGSARTFAEKLGEIAVADLLQETLDEEGHADQHLTRLALRKINAEASGAKV
jgi:ferritin-like metal-binding protein YciE